MIAVLATLALAGCAGPFAVFPGGALEGEVVALDAVAFPATAFPDPSGVIQLETRPGNPYSVNLSTSDISEVAAPAIVTIPAGEASVDFTLSVLDDKLLDGTQTASITVAALKWR